jgi:hypothetical protein
MNVGIWKENDQVREVYFNPDCNAGGQYIENLYSYDLIKDAAKRATTEDEFWDILYSECKSYCYDRGTPEYDNIENAESRESDFDLLNSYILLSEVIRREER